MTDSNSPTHEQIAQRAYEIFIERGQPAGQDLAHWLEAEKQLRAAGQQSQMRAPSQTSGGTQQIASAPLRSSQGNLRAQGNGRTPSRAAARK